MKKSIYVCFLILIIAFPKIFSQQEENKDSDQITEPIEKHPLLSDKFVFNSGLYFPSKTIKIQADGSSENDEIEFNKTFDFDQNEITFASNFHWRFSKKWHLGMEYFGIKNNNSKSIDTEIKWEDDIYPVGAMVEFNAKIDIYRVFFGRVISKGDKHEIGGGLGVHLMDIHTTLSGEVYLDENNKGFERNSVSVMAPLPNIGFWYIYAPTKKWAVTTRIDWFGIEVGDYSGLLWNLAPGIKYQIFNNIGVGVNYRYFSTKFNISKNKLNGGLNIGYHGPLFTISGNF